MEKEFYGEREGGWWNYCGSTTCRLVASLTRDHRYDVEKLTRVFSPTPFFFFFFQVKNIGVFYHFEVEYR